MDVIGSSPVSPTIFLSLLGQFVRPVLRRFEFSTDAKLQFPDMPEGAPHSLKRKRGDPSPARKFKEIVNEVSSDKIVRFFFKPEENLRVGDLLEVTTRSRRSISYGWVSGEHGATYRILKKQAK